MVKIMYPYTDVLSKEIFNLLTDEGKRFSEVFPEFDYEIVKRNELADKLFGHSVVIQSHVFEVFETGSLQMEDIIVADPDVDKLPGYKNITDLLNESFEIIDIPYKYSLRTFIPEEIEIYPKRYEYVYVNVPLAFSYAVFLYKAAIALLGKSEYDEVVLLKYKQ